MTDSAHSDLFLHPSNQTSCVIEEVFDDEQPQTSSTNTHEASTEAAAASETEAQQKTPTPHDLEQRDATASAQGEDHPQAGTSTSGKQDPEQQPSTSAQQQQQATQEQQQEAASDSVGQPVDPQLQQLLDDCERLKQEGNAAYGRGDYDEALQLYWQAIDQAPEGAQQRAVYLCNAAAAYLKKQMWQLAAEQCSQALAINDTYIKALVRRATALQELDDLERALADAQRVLELEPGNSWAVKMVQQLQPEVTERQEKMKEEMIGKLKDLGNNLLGKFGLSLDNFKAEQDPATGGYSIKFAQ